MSACKYIGGLIFFIIATFFSLVAPTQAVALGLHINSFNAPGSIDNWSPWTGDGNSYRNWFDSINGGNYQFQSISYGTGDMSCSFEMSPFCANYGAGGWSRQWLDVTFEVAGLPGEVADVTLDWSWEGSVTLLATLASEANGLSKALVDITRKGETESLYHFEDTSSWHGPGPFWLQPNESFTYGAHIDLGTMAVGDGFSLSAFHESNAWAHTYYIGAATAGMFSTLKIELNATEAVTDPPAPVPEPSTMLLLGTGLVSIAGAARRRKKNQL